MKSTSKIIVVSETRKIRKPLMEKKRRARINDSLETLKQILLESKCNNLSSSDSALDSSLCKKRKNQRTAKLEKADILEMTVHYIQNLQNRLEARLKNEEQVIVGQSAESGCDHITTKTTGLTFGSVTLLPTRLGDGGLAFVIPAMASNEKLGHFVATGDERKNMWRPW